MWGGGRLEDQCDLQDVGAVGVGKVTNNVLLHSCG